MKHQLDVLAVGSALKDIFIFTKDLKCADNKICHPFSANTLGDKINIKNMHFDIGGGGTNIVATFNNLGLRTALITQVGDDTAGHEIINNLKQRKIITTFISIKNKKETGYSVIFISPSGERTAIVFRGASDFHQFNFPKINFNTKWLYLSSVNGNLALVKKIFSFAKKSNAKIAWNPGNLELQFGQKKLKRYLNTTDLLILNIKEAISLIQKKSQNINEIMECLQSMSPNTNICVTAGKKGAWLWTKNKRYYAQPSAIKVINATGAGDAFGSGLVAGLLIYNGDEQKSLRLAMLNAQNAIKKMGAKQGLLNSIPPDKQLNSIKIKIPQ
jgi:sugar/nucleoside kinase (ribokinase family)